MRPPAVATGERESETGCDENSTCGGPARLSAHWALSAQGNVINAASLASKANKTVDVRPRAGDVHTAKPTRALSSSVVGAPPRAQPSPLSLLPSSHSSVPRTTESPARAKRQ